MAPGVDVRVVGAAPISFSGCRGGSGGAGLTIRGGEAVEVSPRPRVAGGTGGGMFWRRGTQGRRRHRLQIENGGGWAFP
jgi:hypothetical protein